MRVLLVDDDTALTNTLERALKAHNMTVDVASDGTRAMSLLELNEYSVVIVDGNLPDLAATEICRYVVSTWPSTKVLVVSEKPTTADRVDGLAAGADDYLAKPFSLEELIARIVALDRRAGASRQPMLTGAGIELDQINRTAYRFGAPLDLTAKEFELLAVFMKSPSVFLSNDQLLERAWEDSTGSRPISVRVTLGRLRAKLGEPDPIRTIKGLGYRFDADPPGTRQTDADSTQGRIRRSGEGILLRTRQRFILSLNHELCGPLARQSAAVEQLRQLRKTDPALAPVSDDLIAITLELRRAIHRLILAEYRFGNPLSSSTADISTLTQRTQAAIQPILDIKHVTIDCEITPQLQVAADRSILLVLINNLLRNAVLHNLDDGWFKLRLYQQGDNAVLEVTNSGATIDPAILTTAREKIRRIDGTLPNLTDQRSGISMTIFVTELLSGRIEFEPLAAGGLHVKVTLPLAPGAAQ